MDRNPICLKVPWSTSDLSKEHLKQWKEGKTGYPFIDVVIRQLLIEGWIHHIARNTVACFLTRGDLWISWEEGLKYFLQYLLDADCTAFEQLLDCSMCICPVNFGRRSDPNWEYIKRYIPELRELPTEYLYEPWKANLNKNKMQDLRESFERSTRTLLSRRY